MIGKLRHRLVLEQAVATPDGAGGASVTWTAVASLWAAIDETAGREMTEADAISGSRRLRAVIRYRDGVGPAMRFRLGGRVLDIEAVRDADGRRRWLACDLIEKGLG